MKKWYTSSESKTPTCVLQVLHTTGKNVSSSPRGCSPSPPPLPPPLPPLPPRPPRPPSAQPCGRQATARQGAEAERTRLSARCAQPFVALHHAVAHEHSSELRVVLRVPASAETRTSAARAGLSRHTHARTSGSRCTRFANSTDSSGWRPTRGLCAAWSPTSRPAPRGCGTVVALAVRVRPAARRPRNRRRALSSSASSYSSSPSPASAAAPATAGSSQRHVQRSRCGTPSRLLLARPPPLLLPPPLHPLQSRTTSAARPRSAAPPPRARERRSAPPRPRPPSRQQPPRKPTARAEADAQSADMRRERAS